MPRLNEDERNQALGMFATGSSKCAIARGFGCHHSTISRLISRFHQTGTVRDRPRPGQPRVTTIRQDAYIRVSHLRNRFLTATNTARRTIGNHGHRIHVNTVRNRLRTHRLKARRPYVGAVLTRRHRQDRLRWGRAHQRFTRQRWSTVLFSDESRIQLNRADGRKRVWRRVGERFSDNCVIERNPWGGGSIHVWGGITLTHKTPLVIFDRNVTANVYINNVLQPVVVPFMAQHFPNGHGILQQDNAPPHTAGVTRRFLNQQNVNVLAWPALSPDMSPIEQVWDVLKTRIARRLNPPQNLQQLRVAAIAEWQNIPQQEIATKINSMHRRCTAVVNANGGHTRY